MWKTLWQWKSVPGNKMFLFCFTSKVCPGGCIVFIFAPKVDCLFAWAYIGIFFTISIIFLSARVWVIYFLLYYLTEIAVILFSGWNILLCFEVLECYLNLVSRLMLKSSTAYSTCWPQRHFPKWYECVQVHLHSLMQVHYSDLDLKRK